MTPKTKAQWLCPQKLDDPIIDIKLHGFADASFKACAALTYFQITKSSESFVQLLTVKSRV